MPLPEALKFVIQESVMTDRKARSNVDGLETSIVLPTSPCSAGPFVIDVTSLTQIGFFTYVPGFMSTASCESKITFIDGAKGVLLPRGYPIEQLAEHSDFLETCYLLLNGELPTPEQREEFVQGVDRKSTRLNSSHVAISY